VITVADREDKTTASRVHGSSSAGSKRPVKSAEQIDSTRRRSTHGRQQRADVQVNNVSSRRDSETSDDESIYYAQCVAPVLNEMTGNVHGESSRGMTRYHYYY